MNTNVAWMPERLAPHEPEFEGGPAARGKCAVLGIGNPLMADDGLGIHVVHALRRQGGCFTHLDSRVELIDGGTLGYLLIDRLAGYDALIVIDAANFRAVPGTVRVLCNDDLGAYLNDRSATSVHEVSLIDLLQMLELCNEGPNSVALVGVQPALIDWSTDLTPDVARSIAPAVDAVHRLVGKWAKGGRLE